MIMGKIESLLIEDEGNLRLAGLGMTASRVHFAKGFDKFCTWLSPTLTQVELDLRHFGDAMYVSFYDRIQRQNKKRKANDLLQEQENLND